ncbi:MAG: hypothetical protein PF542_05450 [Nanoarchaeota archaeon]|jgi:hypothetical protein|nr:hypothetical protein [Nanoarchaeota archaeon]
MKRIVIRNVFTKDIREAIARAHLLWYHLIVKFDNPKKKELLETFKKMVKPITEEPVFVFVRNLKKWKQKTQDGILSKENEEDVLITMNNGFVELKFNGIRKVQHPADLSKIYEDEDFFIIKVSELGTSDYLELTFSKKDCIYIFEGLPKSEIKKIEEWINSAYKGVMERRMDSLYKFPN